MLSNIHQKGKITPSAKKVTLSYLNKVCARIPVIRIPADIGETVLLCIAFKDTFLVAYGV